MDPERKIINVVGAAIVTNGTVLCAQRGPGKSLAGYWEFPGGKVEPGETKEAALVRECQEELGVVVSVGDLFMEVTHSYPDLTVHLTLFHAVIVQGEPQKLEHQDIRWITREEISQYPFCPADDVILARLQAGERGAQK